MKENLYVCDHRDVCDDSSCGGRRPSKLKFTWGVDRPEDYTGIICGNAHEFVHPILYYEISKSEIDILFSWE